MAKSKTLWTGKAGSRTWTDSLNWSSGVPLAGVNAVFSDSGTWRVDLTATPALQAGTLIVSGDHLTFANGSLGFAPVIQINHSTFDMQLSNGAAVTLNRGAAFSGRQTAEIGSFTSTAALTVHGIVAEEFTQVYGTLAITGPGAQWTNGASGLDILGSGQLTVSGGGHLQSSDPNGSLLVEGAGASALVTGKGSAVREPLLFVGQFQAGGAITIAGGATVNDVNGNVGGSGEGTITVTGPGSQWINSSGISIGGQVPSTASLTILKGAHVSFGDFGLKLEGRLSIDGSASLTGSQITSGGGVIMAAAGGPATVTLNQDITINYNPTNPFDSETTYVGAAGPETLKLTGHITSGFSGQPENLQITTGTVILDHTGNSYDATNLYAATLVIAADHAAGTGSMNFIGGSTTPATLRIEPGLAFDNIITGFGASDTIDAAGIHFGPHLVKTWTSSSSGGQLSLSDGHNALALSFNGPLSLASFIFASDPHGGTAITHG